MATERQPGINIEGLTHIQAGVLLKAVKNELKNEGCVITDSRPGEEEYAAVYSFNNAMFRIHYVESDQPSLCLYHCWAKTEDNSNEVIIEKTYMVAQDERGRYGMKWTIRYFEVDEHQRLVREMDEVINEPSTIDETSESLGELMTLGFSCLGQDPLMTGNKAYNYIEERHSF